MLVGCSTSHRQFLLILRHHHYKWKAAKFRPTLLSAYSFEQGRIFIMPYLLWHGAFLVVSYNRQGVLRTYNPWDPYRTIQGCNMSILVRDTMPTHHSVCNACTGILVHWYRRDIQPEVAVERNEVGPPELFCSSVNGHALHSANHQHHRVPVKQSDCYCYKHRSYRKLRYHY
jgi:hypothetical protein